MKVIILAERGGGVATKHWGCGIIMVSQLPLYQHCHHIHSQVTLTVLSVSTQNHPQPCFISLVQQCCLYIQLNSKLSHYIAIYNVGLWRLQKSQSQQSKSQTVLSNWNWEILVSKPFMNERTLIKSVGFSAVSGGSCSNQPVRAKARQQKKKWKIMSQPLTKCHFRIRVMKICLRSSEKRTTLVIIPRYWRLSRRKN